MPVLETTTARIFVNGGSIDAPPDLGSCAHCGEWYDPAGISGRFVSNTDSNYCESCHCSECCHNVGDDEVGDDEDDVDWGEDEDRTDHAAMAESERYSFHSDYEPQPPRLLLPEIEGRPPRLISIEQEVAKGGGRVAELLHDAGYAEYDSVLSYHSGGDGDDALCKVEEDSSVNAEIIYGKLRLHQEGQAADLERALRVVRGAIESGDCKLDMRCGFHVHVDFRGSGMRDVESLYHLWNHVEDTVYRLASANWTSHRSLVAEYNYSPATAKGIETRAMLGRHFQGERGALNLSNYMAARSYCQCGAFDFASWEDCSCNLPKPTVEFRVFNATANLRKVHAYTALSLALVAEAKRKTYAADKYPAFGFTRTTEVEDAERTKRAVAMLFETLPLTRTEKNDLRYCAENSSLADYV